jgi:hypothetical protein
VWQCCAAQLAFTYFTYLETVQTKRPALLRTMREYGIPINTQMSADNLRTPLEAAVLSNNLAALHELLNNDGIVSKVHSVLVYLLYNVTVF